MTGRNKPPLYLAIESELGSLAAKYWSKGFDTEMTYMRITGDGFIAFGCRENLPANTSRSHFTDDTGIKYDTWENRIPIIEIVKATS